MFFPCLNIYCVDAFSVNSKSGINEIKAVSCQSLAYSISEVAKYSWSVAFRAPHHTQASLAAQSQPVGRNNHFLTDN